MNANLASNARSGDLHEQTLVFRLLLGYRWISLLPALIWLAQPVELAAPVGRWTLMVAAGLTLLLTLAARPINRLLLAHPWLLLVDLAASAALVWLTGAEHSPYYLSSLTPILGAAFFFQMRGGILAAATYTALYLPALFLAPRSPVEALDLPMAVAQVISFYLIGAIFGYPSLLVHRLREAHAELSAGHAEMSRRNRDLHLVDELTLVMQSSVDLAEVEETILQGLVRELGYRRAVIGLYDESQQALTGWLTQENLPAPAGPERMRHTDLVRLSGEHSPLATAVRSRQPVEVMDGRPPTSHSTINKRLAAGRHYLIHPLVLRDNTLGVIIVDHLPVNESLDDGDRASLERLAVHAGVTLGSLRLCINRVQREAVSQERNRIAADLHDSISQVLYGLAYGLDACIQLLPDQPDRVRQELRTLYPMVTGAQAQMRSAIFAMRADEIASDTFVARLHRHLHAICPSRTHALRIELPGEFDSWDSELRHDLFRVAQEAMTNAAKHAAARRIVVTVGRKNGQVEVRVEDDGRGFSPADIDVNHNLGLQSMNERVERLGGRIDIQSQTDLGTVVTARIPNVMRAGV